MPARPPSPATRSRNGRGIVLQISKQPGANVIDTVDAIKQAMPRLRTAIPPTVQVNAIIDRTQNIRASVQDVEFTLILTIVLVVLIIFVFLRNVAGHADSCVTVPLALMGTARHDVRGRLQPGQPIADGADHRRGFRGRRRHRDAGKHLPPCEDGMGPMEAAYKGAGEIGFTIVSISVSLIAVFIPLLLMGGIVGRLFREFAVTVTLTILVSVIVSLTLTPMLCSRYLKNQHGGEHGRLFMLFERGFDLMLAGYKRGLQWVLRHQLITLMSFIATVAVTGLMFVIIPKGFSRSRTRAISSASPSRRRIRHSAP